MFPLLGYVGAVLTAIWLVEQFARLLPLREIPTDPRPVDPKQVARYALRFAKEEPIIAILFVTTSAGLIGKYFADWVGPPSNFMETINLFCLIGFWVNFRVMRQPPPGANSLSA